MFETLIHWLLQSFSWKWAVGKYRRNLYNDIYIYSFICTPIVPCTFIYIPLSELSIKNLKIAFLVIKAKKCNFFCILIYTPTRKVWELPYSIIFTTTHSWLIARFRSILLYKMVFHSCFNLHFLISSWLAYFLKIIDLLNFLFCELP